MQIYKSRKTPQSAKGRAPVSGFLMMLRGRAKLIALCAAGIIAVSAAALLLFSGNGNTGEAIAAVDVLLPSPTVSDAAPSPSSTPIPTTTPEVTSDPTLNRGDQNGQVTLLQQRLMDLGFFEMDETTDLYGPATELAVTRFQRQVGLSQTGVADGQTQSWLYSGDAKQYTLLQETSGDDVSSLQRQLNRLGYLASGKITGYYGTETVDAVKKFQQRNKLSVDGKTGEETLDRIYSPSAVPDPSVAAQVRSKANVDKMISVAQAQLGKPYILGNEGPNSFDCSGLVYYCLKQAGSNRGRYNAAGYSQVSDWEKITSMKNVKRGDLLFFWDKSKGKIGHVAIYIGNGMMIDASFQNGKVVKRSANSAWCRDEFRWARRPW